MSPACCNIQQDFGSLETGTVECMGKPSRYYDVWQPYIQPYIPNDVESSGKSCTS